MDGRRALTTESPSETYRIVFGDMILDRFGEEYHLVATDAADGRPEFFHSLSVLPGPTVLNFTAGTLSIRACGMSETPQ